MDPKKTIDECRKILEDAKQAKENAERANSEFYINAHIQTTISLWDNIRKICADFVMKHPNTAESKEIREISIEVGDIATMVAEIAQAKEKNMELQYRRQIKRHKK